MSALSIQVPSPIFNDRDGQPLDNGYVWVGVPQLPPQTNPVNVYFDEALTQIAQQPLRTINGYVSNAGTPAQVYIDGVNFSILVQDSKGSMVYNFPEGTGISPKADGIVYDPAGIAAVPTTVQAKLREFISVEDFGAVQGLSATPSVNDAAFAAALAEAKTRGAGEVLALGQYYVLSSRLNIPDGVTLVGSGVGLWDCVYHSRAKTWRGTSLVFKGTGTRDLSFYGVTGMPDAGGVRTVSALACKLTSFMNSDSSASAVRATRRQFSAAIGPETINGGHHWGLENIRVVPWMGVDGVADYSNTGNTSLGNDWDVGILVQDSEYVTLRNVQAVGYWRIAGVAQINPGLDAYGYGERNRYYDCKFQGYVGVLLRASDRWAVSAATTNSITIKHNTQHYWPIAGSFESTQTGNVHAYTGLTYSGGNLTFTGVTPDPTGTTQIRNPKRGSGVAGTQFHDCMIHGLDHVSGSKATALGFSDPSKALEVSGFPMRGLQFYNSKVQSKEDVLAFFHDCIDFQMFGGQYEGGGRIIASPIESSSTAAAPSGQTNNLRWMSTLISSSDTTGLTPRSLHDDMRQINPQALASSDYDFSALSGQDIRFNMASGMNTYFRRSTGVSAGRFTDSGNLLVENGGQFSMNGGAAYFNVDASANLNIRNGTTLRMQLFGSSGNWGAGADNSQTWGTASYRWSTIYAGTATINTSDERAKQQISGIPPEVLRAWGRVEYLRYKFNDAVDSKKDGARWHIGVIAQRVKEAFEAEGVDPFAYGILCFDRWGDEFEDVMEAKALLDEEGMPTGEAVMVPTGERRQIVMAGELYGIRYEEALALEAAYLRSKLNA